MQSETEFLAKTAGARFWHRILFYMMMWTFLLSFFYPMIGIVFVICLVGVVASHEDRDRVWRATIPEPLDKEKEDKDESKN